MKINQAELISSVGICRCRLWLKAHVILHCLSCMAAVITYRVNAGRCPWCWNPASQACTLKGYINWRQKKCIITAMLCDEQLRYECLSLPTVAHVTDGKAKCSQSASITKPFLDSANTVYLYYGLSEQQNRRDSLLWSPPGWGVSPTLQSPFSVPCCHLVATTATAPHRLLSHHNM